MLVHQIITKADPLATALIFKNSKISYGELQKKVALFQKYFHSQGVQSGDNVGLFSKNSPEFIYSYFAITSLGAVVVPFNFLLAPREIAYIAQDARMKTIVTMQRLELPGMNLTQLVLPEFVPALEDEAVGKLPKAVEDDEDRESVIIYTSGTTGFPKGAVLSHRNLISNAQAISEALLLTEKDNSLCALPMFHSFAWTVAVLASLLKGGIVTIVEAFMPKEVISTITEQGVTVVSGVPAMYNFYISLGSAQAFEKVRLFVSGGAPLPVEVLNQFNAKIGKPIVEGYGLSEASPVVAVNPLSRGKAGSIGVPVPRSEVKIIDARGNELPFKEVGELITRGPNVMKGYYNLPEVTEKAIVNGWLHTGDLAYIDEEGYIFIVDRLKDLIIVGGLNVYPREVEEVIYQFSGIREAAVMGIPDWVRGEDICAFIALQEDAVFDKKAFMSFLQGNLANYKLPKEVIQLEALPKNATGKIMKRELKEMYAAKKPDQTIKMNVKKF